MGVMNEAIISIGSNIASKVVIIAKVIDELMPMIKRQTPGYITPDEINSSNSYLNVVAIVETDLSQDELRTYFKKIEKRFGRDHTQTLVALDIDIVCYDGVILRPVDYEQPYFRHGLKLLNSNPLNT